MYNQNHKIILYINNCIYIILKYFPLITQLITHYPINLGTLPTGPTPRR